MRQPGAPLSPVRLGPVRLGSGLFGSGLFGSALFVSALFVSALFVSALFASALFESGACPIAEALPHLSLKAPHPAARPRLPCHRTAQGRVMTWKLRAPLRPAGRCSAPARREAIHSVGEQSRSLQLQIGGQTNATRFQRLGSAR